MIPKRQYRALTQEEAALLRRQGIDAVKARRELGLLFPIAGGSPDGDDDDDNNDDDDDDDDDDSDDDDSDDDDNDDDNDEEVKVSKKELDALKKIRADQRKAERKAKRDKEKADRDKKIKDGQLQELLDEKDDEIKEKDDEITTLKSEIAGIKNTSKVEKVAKNLGMKDPEDAKLYLDEDTLNAEPKIIESALKKIKKSKPHLFGKRPASGGSHDTNGDGKNGDGKKILTIEEIKAKLQGPDGVQWGKDNQDLIDRSMAASGQD